MGEKIFSDEELNILGNLTLNEKNSAEKAIFKQNPIDPEWQKYLDNISGLIEKLRKMKD